MPAEHATRNSRTRVQFAHKRDAALELDAYTATGERMDSEICHLRHTRLTFAVWEKRSRATKRAVRLAARDYFFHNPEETIWEPALPSLSTLEEFVLMAIVAHKGQAYGVSIHDALSSAGMRSSLGAIYSSLDRLEQEGMIRSELGDATASRGGRRKRLFRATPQGKTALARSADIRARLMPGKLHTSQA